MRVKRLAACVAMAVCLAAAPALASDWNVGSGLWANGGNWLGGLPNGTPATIDNAGTATLQSAVPDITTLNMGGFSQLNVNAGADLTSTGDARVAYAGFDEGYVVQGGGSVSLGASLTLGASGGDFATWTMTNDASLGVGNDLIVGDAGAGQFQLGDTSNLTVGGNIDIARSAGGAGTLTVSGSSTLTQTGGSLNVGGSGLGGTLRIEGAATTINVVDYEQTSTGSLDLEMNDFGIAPINVSGNAALHGALNVSVAGGASVPDGVYDIITADTRTSGFETTSLPAGMSVWYGENDVKLYVGIDPPPGSYGLRAPYTPDANTIHLYHMDGAESTTIAVDSAGTLDLNMTGYHQPSDPTTIGETASAVGFGECFDVDTSSGYTGQISGSVSGPVEAVGSADGAWTAEGIVKWNGYNDSLHVFNVSGSYIRVIVYPSAPYILVDIGADSQITLNDGVTYDRNFPIPSPTANEWYHWAVTYNGLEDTPDNVKVYWTPLDPDYTEAQLMDSRRAKLDQGSGGGSFGTAYRLCGWADEMRVSNIVRAPDDMMFLTPGVDPVVPEPAGLGLIGLALLAVRRRRG